MGDGTTAAPGGISPRRRALLPSPTLPLVYFGGAHLALAAALAVVAVRADVLGAFFYHPRALALVHLVTLGWISGSILGAMYIVAPLVLGIPLRPGRLDGWACASFWAGTAGMVSGFWGGRFELVAAGSLFVLGPVLAVALRVGRGLLGARLPAGVSLHVALAFCNLLAAGAMGIALALSRRGGGWLPGSPMALAASHAHLAALGWAAMMAMGIGYRLIPMFAPSAIPAGRGLLASAVLLEIGAVGLAAALAIGGSAVPWALCVTAAFLSFFVRIAGVLRDRRPRPADLPPHDWSTWQTFVALGCLLAAIGVGLLIAPGGASPAWLWVYGVLGLLGFLGQIVVGIGGRLLPMYGWYRALERGDGALPARSVHRLIEPRLAGTVLVLWLAGLPALAAGLASQREPLIAAGAAVLFAATAANAWHLVVMVRRAAAAQ